MLRAHVSCADNLAGSAGVEALSAAAVVVGAAGAVDPPAAATCLPRRLRPHRHPTSLACP